MGLALIYKQEWPVLIVCPSSLKLNWKDEILNWITSIPKEFVVIIQTTKQQFPKNGKIFIMSYEIACRHESTIKEKKF